MSDEWRMLGPEEKVQEGDESRPPGEECFTPVHPKAWIVGKKAEELPTFIFRRRVTVQEAAEALEANPYYLALRHAEEKLQQAEHRAEKAEALQCEASAALTWANEVLADYRTKLQKAEARLKEDPNGWNIVDQMEAVNKSLQEKLQKAEAEIGEARLMAVFATGYQDRPIGEWKARARELLESEQRAVKAEKEREMAELCLREIYIALGNSDPADGEGVSREDVVRAVEEAEKERDEAKLSLRLSVAELALRETERDQLRAENERLNAEIELHRKGEFDDSWQRQCEENERLESENERLREALEKIAKETVINPDYEDFTYAAVIAQKAPTKGEMKSKPIKTPILDKYNLHATGGYCTCYSHPHSKCGACERVEALQARWSNLSPEVRAQAIRERELLTPPTSNQDGR